MSANIITLAGARVAPVTLAQGLAHFLDRLKSRQASISTQRGYESEMADFIDFAETSEQITLIGLVTERTVQHWLDRLGHRGLCSRSQARALSILRSFCRHCRVEGWIDHDPTRAIKVRIRHRRVIAPEHDVLQALIDSIPPQGTLNLRDRAMLRVTFDAALRISEVCGLDVYDPLNPPRAFLDARRLLVQVVGKGGDDEVIGVNERTVAIVTDWLAVRGKLAHRNETALFVSQRGTRLTRQMAHYRIKHWGALFGIPRIHWHLLRHRRIGDVIDKLGLDAGQFVARHASRATTADVYGAHATEVVRTQVRRECDLDAGRAAA